MKHSTVWQVKYLLEIFILHITSDLDSEKFCCEKCHFTLVTLIKHNNPTTRNYFSFLLRKDLLRKDLLRKERSSINTLILPYRPSVKIMTAIKITFSLWYCCKIKIIHKWWFLLGIFNKKISKLLFRIHNVEM
jgi:hypothetical protein